MLGCMAEFEQFTPKVVLAIGAHADDIDVMCGASIARWTADGAQVHYLVLTDGSKGSSDLAMESQKLALVRQQEQRDAASVLGSNNVQFLTYEDGMLEITQSLKKDIVRVIRQVRPDTVVVMDPTLVYSAELGLINHPDHRAAGQATLDAVYPLCRDHLSFPDLLTQEHLEPHKVPHVLLTNYEASNYYVDVSATFDHKLNALAKHNSQFSNMEDFGKTLRVQAEKLGSKVGSQYAEGFVRIDIRS